MRKRCFHSRFYECLDEEAESRVQLVLGNQADRAYQEGKSDGSLGTVFPYLDLFLSLLRQYETI